MFTEEELRSLLRLLDTAPVLQGSRYNPLSTIRIVNRLQRLGKEKALAAIDEYLRVTPAPLDSEANEGVFLVHRVLFDIPEPPGYMPVMWVGAPSPEAPKDPKLLPRFPIVIVDDVPILVIRGYDILAVPQRVEEHVAYFRKHGKLRANQLRPTLFRFWKGSVRCSHFS
jgi:hypothetical protein